MAEARPDDGDSGIDWLGLQYQSLSPSLRSLHGVPDNVEGVLISNVTPTSPLYEQAVRPGSIITEVNGREVKSVEEFEEIVKAAKPKSYLRFYAMNISQRGENVQPFFAVVLVP